MARVMSEDRPLKIEPEPAPHKWRNPHSALPRIRWVVQGGYALFLLAVGLEFHAFYRQAVSGGPISAHRPPAVEGFLPISALVALKRFLVTGNWDDVHPAGLTILIAALASALVARKAFCSWICPVGMLSRALEWFGEKTLWRRRRAETLVPGWLDKGLSALKYAVLAFFSYGILVKMSPEAIEAFLHSPYNYGADAKMLLFFVDLSATAGIVLGVLGIASVVVKNFWCRYLCPYGALLGLASWLSPQRVVRDPQSCIDCRVCTKRCPSEILVHRKNAVWSPECAGCMACVAACPVKDCLTVGRRAGRGWSPYLVPTLAVGTLVALWLVARLTGHWHSRLDLDTLVAVYRYALGIGHP